MTGTATPDPEVRRLDYFDGLRGWAAIGVVLCHFASLFDHGLFSGHPQEARWGFEKYIANSPLRLPIDGTFPVQIFFVLSGFVLVKAFLGNRTFLGALVRRYLRLALPVAAASLFAWLLLLTGPDFGHELIRATQAPRVYEPEPFQHLTFGKVWGQAVYNAFINSNSVAQQLNGALWTIPVEFSGSLLILVLVLVLRRKPGWDVAGLLALSACTWGTCMFFMICGVWLYFLTEKGALRLNLRNPFVAAALGGATLLLASYPPTHHPVWVYRLMDFDIHPFFDFSWQQFLCFVPLNDNNVFCQGVGAVLLVGIVVNSRRLMDFLGRFTFLGKISFPLYLIHKPLLYVAGGAYFWFEKLSFGYAVSCLLTLAVYLTVCLAIAWVGYFLVERPAVRLSRKAGAAIDSFLERSRRLV